MYGLQSLSVLSYNLKIMLEIQLFSPILLKQYQNICVVIDTTNHVDVEVKNKLTWTQYGQIRPIMLWIIFKLWGEEKNPFFSFHYCYILFLRSQTFAKNSLFIHGRLNHNKIEVISYKIFPNDPIRIFSQSNS